MDVFGPINRIVLVMGTVWLRSKRTQNEEAKKKSKKDEAVTAYEGVNLFLCFLEEIRMADQIGYGPFYRADEVSVTAVSKFCINML